MKIVACRGYELEKAQPNTSEDFFNRSEVTFIDDDGTERTLHVLYVRYFDEQFTKWTPYEQDPLFKVGERDVFFKDIVALVCLLKNPAFRQRKRVYINDEQQFGSYFADFQFERLQDVFEALETKKGYELKSPLLFIAQP
ncbi:hypothetical protein EDD69_101104 [Thermolongibacillus altinsuensis]|jgi:hypothetical protein|uniref:Uncharacterized protein n=1 Tax=Thermolongibacillus altinsuensis TaxID=575256 RepID=A0A4R1QHR4_9BACL|nr:hypothetical protein [Thermolongibacillus altinsuensis]TCL53098.1 hypothetical protein EDD69_101104 [Thermolongibacillus altinsuensis]GMB07801.1 hypothetical protein B1no1_05110 [Thermolongibacillus altinsuensis]